MVAAAAGAAGLRGAARPRRQVVLVAVGAWSFWSCSGGDAKRAVRLRVDTPGKELALDVRVPVVLDLVVSTAWQPPGYLRPPVCFAARITESKQV